MSVHETYCPNCLERVKIKEISFYLNHLYYSNTDEYKPFICPVCGAIFSLDKNFNPFDYGDRFDIPEEVMVRLVSAKVAISMNARWRYKNPYDN